MGGSVPTIFTLLIELLAPTNRGFYVNVVAFCWVLGMVFTAGVAWLILGVARLPWQWFAATCGLPALLAAVLVLFLVPESPLWLARVGRVQECSAALALIASWNRKPAPRIVASVDVGAEASALAGGPGLCRRVASAARFAATTLRTFYCGRGGHVRSAILLSVVW